MSAQQQLIDLLQAELTAAATSAGVNVFVDRVDPFQPDELPAICIEESNAGETGEVVMLGGEEMRTLEVTVCAVVKDTASAASQARTLGSQIETALANSAAVIAICKGGISRLSSRHDNSGSTNLLTAQRVLEYQLRYVTHPKNPTVIL